MRLIIALVACWAFPCAEHFQDGKRLPGGQAAGEWVALEQYTGDCSVAVLHVPKKTRTMFGFVTGYPLTQLFPTMLSLPRDLQDLLWRYPDRPEDLEIGAALPTVLAEKVSPGGLLQVFFDKNLSAGQSIVIQLLIRRSDDGKRWGFSSAELSAADRARYDAVRLVEIPVTGNLAAFAPVGTESNALQLELNGIRLKLEQAVLFEKYNAELSNLPSTNAGNLIRDDPQLLHRTAKSMLARDHLILDQEMGLILVEQSPDDQHD